MFAHALSGNVEMFFKFRGVAWFNFEENYAFSGLMEWYSRTFRST